MRSPLGLYRPGDSVLHRLPAGTKLLALVIVGMFSVLIQRWWWVVLASLLLVASLYLLAGFTMMIMWRQLKPVVYLMAIMIVFHIWASGWQRAISVTGAMLMVIALAALVTLTTQTSALVAACQRAVTPLSRFGVDPDRVGLMLTLGIRCVPLIAGLAGQVREAQIARGQETVFKAFAVPLIVRALREADAIGEALMARGVDD